MRGAESGLTIVIGKGGVGRSTVAAALAITATARGLRVLAIDAIASGGLATAFELQNRPEPGVMMALEGRYGGVTILELGTEASLDQYVRLTVKIPISPRSLGPIARIFDYVATAAPAVREILTIGKIGHEATRGGWDLVVVDGPATGHVIELLAAPDALGELVDRGPLAAETGWLSALLADGETTSILAVTTPEELPVSETVELLARVGEETRTTVGGLIVNRIPPEIGPAGRAEAERLVENGSPLGPLASTVVHRHETSIEQQARLEELGLATVLVGEDLADPIGAATAALAEAGW